MNEQLTLEFDGGSRGNPGPAGIGVVVRAADGTPLVTLGRFIGRATNNVAEYTALITALHEAQKLGARKVLIRGDSELIIKQMRGEYRVRHPDMRLLYEKAQAAVHQFEHVRIEHNLRHKNELADKLANHAMDRRAEVTEVRDSGITAPPRPADSSRPNIPPSVPKAMQGNKVPADFFETPAPQSPKPGDIFACPRCGCLIEIRRPSSIRPHQLKPFVCQCGQKMSGV